FDSEGQHLESVSISSGRGGPAAGGSNTNWKTLQEAKSENLGQGDKADYFSCVGTVVYLRKENCMYQACPTQDCNKKVIDEQNGLFRCEKCDREFPNFKYRMILSVSLGPRKAFPGGGGSRGGSVLRCDSPPPHGGACEEPPSQAGQRPRVRATQGSKSLTWQTPKSNGAPGFVVALAKKALGSWEGTQRSSGPALEHLEQ
ncbi:replication protein A 70 kDa DNA-binding subunit-like, partial [Notechis scutatus]|uniref:Replication protein A 70 kDa DNA-binding subunit-like n=1 Tax=Notechis scutatus TaxID=8663 RepID=A0A6J1W4L3_9SAUR